MPATDEQKLFLIKYEQILRISLYFIFQQLQQHKTILEGIA